MTPDAAPARQLPPVGHRARLADDPWRIGEGAVRAAGAAARTRTLFTSVYDPDRWPDLAARPRGARLVPRPPARRPAALPEAAAADEPAFESFDLSEYDLVVSSSHSCAKNVLTGSRHAARLLLPHADAPRLGAAPPGRRAGRRPRRSRRRMMLGRLRRDDLAGASRPDVFVANSNHVAARIRKHYRRDAVVIHPPVDVERHLHRPRRRGRLLPRARPRGALQEGRPGRWRLRHAGAAGQGRRARGAAWTPPAPRPGRAPSFSATSPTTRSTRCSRARAALLFPGEEDFGIVPVEAQAAGVPVIAYGEGGVRDTVDRGRNRCVSCRADRDLGRVRHPSGSRACSSTSTGCRANARRFGPARFRAEIDRRAARARARRAASVSATPDLRFEPERERDSVAYALGVLRRRWLVVVAAVAICLPPAS